MIRVGAEIEPGISAAEASYRLRADIYLAEDLFSIGTEAMPFCGRFDGDGHWIHGKAFKARRYRRGLVPDGRLR